MCGRRYPTCSHGNVPPSWCATERSERRVHRGGTALLDRHGQVAERQGLETLRQAGDGVRPPEAGGVVARDDDLRATFSRLSADETSPPTPLAKQPTRFHEPLRSPVRGGVTAHAPRLAQQDDTRAHGQLRAAHGSRRPVRAVVPLRLPQQTVRMAIPRRHDLADGDLGHAAEKIDYRWSSTCWHTALREETPRRSSGRTGQCAFYCCDSNSQLLVLTTPPRLIEPCRAAKRPMPDLARENARAKLRLDQGGLVAQHESDSTPTMGGTLSLVRSPRGTQ